MRWVLAAERDDVFVPSEAILVPSELNIALCPFWSHSSLHAAGVKKPNKNHIISLQIPGATASVSCLPQRNKEVRLVHTVCKFA